MDAVGNAILLGDSGGSFKRDETPGAGEGDAWIVQLDAAGNVVQTWTWGSAGWDTIGAAVWSRREPGVFYVAGNTTANLFSTHAGGGPDIFVAKVRWR